MNTSELMLALASNLPNREEIAALAVTEFTRGQNTARANFGKWLKSGSGVGQITLFSDSTAISQSQWLYLGILELAARYPDLRIVYKLFDDSTQAYGVETLVQAGSAGERYFRPSGTGTPNAPYTQFTDIPAGDCTFIAKVNMDDWSPAGLNRYFAGRWDDATHRSWLFGLFQDKLYLSFTSDGATQRFLQSTVTTNPTIADGTDKWVRVDLDVDNGAAQVACSFFTSDDGFTWVALGTNPVNGAFGTIAGIAQPTPASIAICNGGTTAGGTMAGKLYRLIIRATNVNGANLLPTSTPDEFPKTGGSDTGTVEGSQTLYVNNCSVSGIGAIYLSDATRLTKSLIPSINHMVVISTGHNDCAGTVWLGSKNLTALYDTWLTAIYAASPSAAVVGCLGNARTSAASWLYNYEQVISTLRAYFQRKGLDVCSFYDAYMNAAGGDLSLLVNPDGVHPLGPGSVVAAREFVTPML